MSMDTSENPEGTGIYKNHERLAVYLPCGHLCYIVPVRADGKCCACAHLKDQCDAHPPFA